jgi:hypothetical protein
MRKLSFALLLGFVLLPAAWPQAKNPFLGRWDFTLTPTANARFNASWMGVSEKQGKVEVFFQPSSAHVIPVASFKIRGSHMSVVVNKATKANAALALELDVANGKITGVQKRGNQTTSVVAVPAPELKRSAPAAWTDPVPLFNGKNLDGWEAVASGRDMNWTVKDGLLVNDAQGVNIKTTRKFDDFKLHYEVYCPQRANSGFYLRGRYEIQISGGPGSPASPAPPPPAPAKGRGGNAGGRAGGRAGSGLTADRAMGAVYGRVTPTSVLTTPPDGWDTFDITLVGRTVTIVRNGVTTIDQKEIEGITGGALDSNEGEPGPFYIQGDHTGNVKFRNMTISVPKS